MEIKYYGKSDVGRVRSGNEDYFASEKISRNENLFIVADGMGGHKAGDIASKLGTETFISEFKKNRAKKVSIIKSMNLALRSANIKILETANAEIDKRGMGTTFSAILFTEGKANIIHVGDSRIYLIRDKKMERITSDHTFVEKMFEEGRITRDEARRHPQKNILYMSLGAREVFNPFIVKDFKVKEGDKFLLCSDGLTDMVEDNVIKEYCLSYPPKKSVEELIDLGNRNGGIDNITLLNIQIGKSFTKDHTHPIKIESEKVEMKGFLLKLSLIILALIFLLFGIKAAISYFTQKVPQEIVFSPLSPEELNNLQIVRSYPEDGPASSEIPTVEKSLYIEKKRGKDLIFFEKFFIIKSGTGKSIKKYYFSSGKRIKLDKVFFIKDLNFIVAFDDENKVYKVNIKK